MLQDIFPHQLRTLPYPQTPKPEDFVLVFKEDTILLDSRKETHALPLYKDISANLTNSQPLTYLLTVDDTSIFLLPEEILPLPDGYKTHKADICRTLEPSWFSFATITACQLARWYNNHTYCGRCAKPMEHSTTERALCCNSCHIIEYPKISPAVIVAIVDKTRLLMTKYTMGNYRNYALVAGFMEVGETFEDTIHREVMEEVGLKVKNIRYFNSQPWAFSDSILAGFFADLDGSPEVNLQDQELSEASWFERENLPVAGSSISLTYEMTEAFRNNQEAIIR